VPMVDITVRSFSGASIELPAVALSAAIGDIKARVWEQWGIPAREQRLVLGTAIAANTQRVEGVLSDAGLSGAASVEFWLVRGPAFNFNTRLAHPRARLDPECAELSHGGQSEYQAAFLSDILSPQETYMVPFKLYDRRTHGRLPCAQMFIGVAPDANRNWSNLKGAYVNHRGFYVDAFCESGWLDYPRCRPWRVRSMIFSRAAQEDSLAALAAPAFDWSGNGEPGGGLEWMSGGGALAPPEEDRPWSFAMEVDMPSSRLKFWTSCGELVDTLHIPELAEEPVRVCATVGYPGQRVVIADAT